MAYTLTFREDVKGWVSFKSFIPEFGISMANNYYTFSKGKLYQHHREDVDRNLFYNIPYDCSFKVIVNSFPDTVKAFNTLNYEGTQSKVNKFVEYQVPNDNTWYTDLDYYNLSDKPGWHVTNIQTDLQNGTLPEFKGKENKWFNYIKGINVETTIDGVITNFLDPGEFSFQGLGYVDGVNIFVGVFGCTDPDYIEYSPGATIDDGSCSELIVEGCMNSDATNYNASANVDNGSCVILGCNDPTAFNYNTAATADDGSCIPIIYGCLDSNDVNYYASANTPCDGTAPGCDGTVTTCGGPGTYPGECCEDTVLGCTNPNAPNYNPNANVDDGTCIIGGCTDSTALNYDPLATADCAGIAGGSDVSCCCYVSGCTDSTAVNYNAAACQDDGSCIACVYGCMDSIATNYDPNATCDDGTCTGNILLACTDPTADNYDPSPNAVSDNDLCNYCVSPIQFDESLGGPNSNTSTLALLYGYTSNNNPNEALLVINNTWSASLLPFNQNQTSPNNAVIDTFTIWTRDCGSSNSNFGTNNYGGCSLWTTRTLGTCPPQASGHACSVLSGSTVDWINVDASDFSTSGWAHSNQGTFDVDGAGSAFEKGLDHAYEIKVVATCVGGTTYEAIHQFASIGANVSGCTDPTACNYNSNATNDDGSCEYASCYGCTDPNSPSYDSNATTACDGSLPFPAPQCTHDINGNMQSGPDCCCSPPIVMGCMDTQVGKNADVNGDVNGTLAAVPTPGSFPCLGTNNGGTNPFVHPDSTNTNCMQPNGDPYGYLATNYDPTVSVSGSGGNLSTGIQGLSNNGCTYIAGCMDDGNQPSNGTYNYTPYIGGGPEFLEANGGHYPTAGGSLTPGLPALNYNPFAGIDDGSCIPQIIGCMDEFDGNSNPNKNVGRRDNNNYTSQTATINPDWPMATTLTTNNMGAAGNMWADIPVVGYENRRDSGSLISWIDVNVHSQSTCILVESGCMNDGSEPNNDPTAGPVNPDTGWTIKKGAWGHISGGNPGNWYGTSSRSHSLPGIFNNQQFNAANASTTTATNSLLPWDVKDNEIFQQIFPNGAAVNHGGSSFGAYNHEDYYAEDFDHNIVQPWSPVNMQACCFVAGCLHPYAYNFDLIGYRYGGIAVTGNDPNDVFSNGTFYQPAVPSASEPVYDPNESIHESCAFCDGTPAAEFFRTDGSGEASYHLQDPDTWDGIQGFNSTALNSPTLTTQMWWDWSGYQDYSDAAGDPQALGNNSGFPKKYDCCCFEPGCQNPNADNYDSTAQCDDGSCCSDSPNAQTTYGFPSCQSNTGNTGPTG